MIGYFIKSIQPMVAQEIKIFESFPFLAADNIKSIQNGSGQANGNLLNSISITAYLSI